MPFYGKALITSSFATPGLTRRLSEESAYVSGPPPRTPRWSPEATLIAARKWNDVFGTPMGTIMSIVDIESAHNPIKVNMARAEKGGAWGLGQQMLDEAPEKIARIVARYGRIFPQVRATAKKWKGKPENLLDPDLNLMLTAWQLGKLHATFGDFPTVAAAYHQGSGAVLHRLATGKPAVSRAQPLGLAYVSMAKAAREKYAPLIYAFAD
jgi:hypothetical protein